jgi:hypothetical protein
MGKYKMKFVEMCVSNREIYINKVECLELDEGEYWGDVGEKWFLSNIKNEEDREYYKNNFEEYIVKDVGVLEVGEDNLVIGVGEDNEWFNKLNNYENWGKDVRVEWVSEVIDI